MISRPSAVAEVVRGKGDDETRLTRSPPTIIAWQRHGHGSGSSDMGTQSRIGNSMRR